MILVKKSKSIITLNRKAKFNFQISEKIESGIVLKGVEVKSIRKGSVSLENSYAVDNQGEFFIKNLYIDLKNYKKNY